MINNKFNINNNMYGILSAILILILFAYGHEYIALAGVIVLIVLVLYYLKEAKDKRLQQELHIKSLAQDMSLAAEETLIKLPFPLVIVDEKGEIHWFNNLLNNIFEKQIMLGSNINTLIKSINIEDIFKKKKEIYKDIIINKKHYNIYSKIMNSSTDKGAEKIVMLYLHDISNVTDIIATKESIMLIEVDNLNEVVKSTENDNAPLLIAEIERTINNYAQNLNAMIKKYDSNKYILSVQDKYIETQMSKKFDILDTVREINMGNKYDVTLSIGVGRNGISPLENHKYASTAKELALGRGGDQAVIKSGDNVAFFGGNTKEVEKRTRVRARVVAHALKDLVNESSTVYIMGHRNPDMDCLGAAVGLSSVVQKLNKECHIVLQDANSSIRYILDKLKTDSKYDNLFITPEKCKEEMDINSILILVDVHSKGYVQDIEIVNMSSKVVIIDHHRRTPDYIEGAILTYIEAYASSTSELITEMLQYMLEKPKLNQIEAEALLAGICVDTKNFYFKTGVRTFEAASFLRKLGADTIDVKKMFGNDLTTYVKKADIIRSAKVENNIAIAICPPDIQETVLAAQAADELLNITGIQASFVLVTIDKDIHISGRSLGDINVQVILESLGGGGHMTMAGAKLNNLSLDEAVELLNDAIIKNLREGESK